MIVALPKDTLARTRALRWLSGEGLSHLKLFQAVQFAKDSEGERFKAWLRESDSGTRGGS